MPENSTGISVCTVDAHATKQLSGCPRLLCINHGRGAPKVISIMIRIKGRFSDPSTGIISQLVTDPIIMRYTNMSKSPSGSLMPSPCAHNGMLPGSA